ncbi:MAG: hypothetical protein Solumvirus6_15 [Solumvirus sp.]|uniref:Uncharacterized protein n=1 Tax=Solumvirus sp. TaxID=2487773 RepID=A0A3G5AGX3_9VIRU|nr:MAG: hypothetical protein Solumvirus6_15 [Solumvirus sp.]
MSKIFLNKPWVGDVSQYTVAQLKDIVRDLYKSQGNKIYLTDISKATRVTIIHILEGKEGVDEKDGGVGMGFNRSPVTSPRFNQPINEVKAPIIQTTSQFPPAPTFYMSPLAQPPQEAPITYDFAQQAPRLRRQLSST